MSEESFEEWQNWRQQRKAKRALTQKGKQRKESTVKGDILRSNLILEKILYNTRYKPIISQREIRGVLDEAAKEFTVLLMNPNMPKDGIIQMTVPEYEKFCATFADWFKKWFGEQKK